jgi:hypothetical protein
VAHWIDSDTRHFFFSFGDFEVDKMKRQIPRRFTVADRPQVLNREILGVKVRVNLLAEVLREAGEKEENGNAYLENALNVRG